MNLCTTCKAPGIDPQAYLSDVLGRISTHPARRIEELLPDRWQALRQAGATAKGGPAPSPGYVSVPDERGATACAAPPGAWNPRSTAGFLRPSALATVGGSPRRPLQCRKRVHAPWRYRRVELRFIATPDVWPR